MGTSTSVDAFASKIAAGGKAIEKAEKVTIAESAQAGKKIMQANMGFTRLRGVGKKGAKVGVRYKIVGGSHPSALLSYFGAVHLVNNNTSPHRIEPKAGRRGAKALNVGGNLRANADHPGTRGKKFFEHSKPQVATAAGKIQQRNVSTTLRSIY